MKNYSAIILSAGYSSRMGNFKPLMDLLGETPLQRCIDLFEHCGIKDIIVVTGYLNKSVEKELKGTVRTVFNDKYSEGMFSSIKIGAAALSKTTDAFFILPVDIPSVQTFTIEKMIESYEKVQEAIIYPTFNEEKGHPVLITYSLVAEILSSNPQGGMREILKLHEEKWHYEKVADRGILLDMDTKGDFEILSQHVSAYPCPDYEECMEILRLCNVRDDIILHMKSVSYFAKKIALLMNEKGYYIDVNKMYFAALLHDVAKGKTNHAEEGAKIIKSFGYPCISEIISLHMELKKVDKIDEKEIVYICDKLIKGTELVNLEDRFKQAFQRYEQEPDILKNVNKKYNDAKIIKEIIEKILGESLENLR